VSRDLTHFQVRAYANTLRGLTVRFPAQATPLVLPVQLPGPFHTRADTAFAATGGSL